jgi:hypothetical protein
VSKAERLANLRTLLERVRSRSRAPLPAGYAAAKASAAAPPEEPVQLTTWTPPPPDEAPREAGIDVDVDYVETVQASAPESARDDAAPARLDSTERLVAASSAARDLTPEPAPPPAHDDSPAAADQTSLLEAEAEEAVEPSPASSRRPVMPEPEERLEQMAFGAEEVPPPIHTPPPESGRVPAAPSDDFEPEEGAVLTTRPPAQPLVAEETRARLDNSVEIAEVGGHVARWTPTTFLALLEETLRL